VKRFTAKHTTQKVRNSKKERFWSGSGKFFVILVILYSLLLGINEIVSIGKEEVEKYSAQNIEINGCDILSHENILELGGIKNINETTEIETEQIAKKLLETPIIKGVSITMQLPRTLIITIEERKPIAFIYGKGLNLIDEEGYLIPVPKVKKLWDLPYVSGISENLGSLGEKTESLQALKTISLVNYIRNKNVFLSSMISEINLSHKDFLEIILVSGGAKIKLNKNNFEKELYILQNYINNFLDLNELANIDYIDLRFQDQLVVKPRT